MSPYRRLALSALVAVSLSLSAQTFKAERLKLAIDALKLHIPAEALQPDQTTRLQAGDGRTVCIHTTPKGEIDHVGIPLFNDVMRFLQPSPVYDFLEYAVLNWKYKVMANQLYLSKVIFRKGSWGTLLRERLEDCDCTIENKDDKLYIVTWSRDARSVAEIGIPIEYELLNNDTRRNMERALVRELEAPQAPVVRATPGLVTEDDLSIYGTEGLFVIPGKWYIVDLLNQNVYYKLTTVYEKADTVIWDKPVTMTVESVLPVVVDDPEFPAETFANLMMCDDSSVPDATVELDFHLSNYHQRHITMAYSQLKGYLRQQGCSLYFACDGRNRDQLRGVMFACNLQKGYNHLFSLRASTGQLTSEAPSIRGDVYLYIPPVTKEKLLGTAPTKKSGAKFKLP